MEGPNYVYIGFFVIFIIVLLIAQILKISNDGKKDMLNEIFNNGDISTEAYKKYKKKLD